MKKTFLKVSLLLVSSALLFSSCVKEPTASFTASKSTAQVGEPVVFTSSSESLKNTSFAYDFGDGTQIVSGVMNPSHTYLKAGVYTVSQFVKASANAQKATGKSATVTTTVTITSAAADFTASKTACSVGEKIILTNATTGDDGLGSKVYYSWQVLGSSLNSSDKSCVWVPTEAGVFTVVLTATQGDSKTTKSMDITVGVSNSLDADKLAGLLEGEWTVSVKAEGQLTPGSLTGYIPVPKYTKVSFDEKGDAVTAVEVITSNLLTTTNSVDVSSSAVGIGYINSTSAYVSGLITDNSSNLPANGIYKFVGTPSSSSIVLSTKVEEIVSVSTTVAPYYQYVKWEVTYIVTLTK